MATKRDKTAKKGVFPSSPVSPPYAPLSPSYGSPNYTLDSPSHTLDSPSHTLGSPISRKVESVQPPMSYFPSIQPESPSYFPDNLFDYSFTPPYPPPNLSKSKKIEVRRQNGYIWLASWVSVLENVKIEDFDTYSEYFEKVNKTTRKKVEQITERFKMKNILESVNVLFDYIPARQLSFVKLTCTDAIFDVIAIFRSLRPFSKKELGIMKEFVDEITAKNYSYYDYIAILIMQLSFQGEVVDDLVNLILGSLKTLKFNLYSENYISDRYIEILLKYEQYFNHLNSKNDEKNLELARNATNEVFRQLGIVLVKQNKHSVDSINAVYDLVMLNLNEQLYRNDELDVLTSNAPESVLKKYISSGYFSNDMERLITTIIDGNTNVDIRLLKWIGMNKYFDVKRGVIYNQGRLRLNPLEYSIYTKNMDAVKSIQRVLGVRMYGFAWKLAKQAGLENEIKRIKAPK